MAGMEGLLSNQERKWTHQYVDGDPRRPASLHPMLKPGRKGDAHLLDTGGGQGQHKGKEGEGHQPDKFAGIGIGVTGLVAENLACHPFIILRRQCQVNVEGRRFHTTPLTLIPVLVNLNRWQGGSVLWKGIGSSLTIKGLTLGVEDCLSKVTPWPKAVDQHSSMKSLGQHLLLKSVSTALITPFYSASLVECVQSEIASEKPGILDVFKEGFKRLISWSDPRCGRMLPVWVLVPPQVFHAVAHYTISSVVQSVWLQVLKATHREYQKLTGAVSRDPQLGNLPGLSQYQAQAASLTGHLVAECLLYPLETVLHRLHLQGTRTIIDNLDSGREVIPILTRYEGVSDCFSTILREEGISGLFKGFGAALLQYAVHFLIIKFSSKLIQQIAQLFTDPRMPFDPSHFGVGKSSEVGSSVPSYKGEVETSASGKGVKLASIPQDPEDSFPQVPSVPQASSGGSGPTFYSSSVSEAVSAPMSLQSSPAARKPIHTEASRTKDSSLHFSSHIAPYGSGTPDAPAGVGVEAGGAGVGAAGGLPVEGQAPGLPSLLNFSKTSQKRILPEPSGQDFMYPYDKSWRSMDKF